MKAKDHQSQDPLIGTNASPSPVQPKGTMLSPEAYAKWLDKFYKDSREAYEEAERIMASPYRPNPKAKSRSKD